MYSTAPDVEVLPVMAGSVLGADGRAVVLTRDAKTPADYVDAVRAHLDPVP